MRDFRKMQIWSQGMDLTVEAYELVKRFPREEEYGLKSQIRRAAVSIPSNIAEGCSRSSQKEFKRYLEIALGSAFEVENHFILSQRLQMISENDSVNFIERLRVEQRQINALIIKVAEMR